MTAKLSVGISAHSSLPTARALAWSAAIHVEAESLTPDERPVDPVVIGASAPRPTAFAKLSENQVLAISRVGGQGTTGHGTLMGIVRSRSEGGLLIRVPVLVTSGDNSDDEVRFALDGPAARLKSLIGRPVRVEGDIVKTTDRLGIISVAEVDPVPGVKEPAFVTVKGVVRNLTAGSDDSSTTGLPTGSWLLLDPALSFEGRTTKRVFLQRDFAEGEQLELRGQLELHAHPDYPDGHYGQLSGVSDVANGEPVFNGHGFKTAGGQGAPTLMLEQRSIRDAPDLIVVVDPQAKRAFEGNMGGLIGPDTNPFHGFTGTSFEIKAATPGDQASVGRVVTDGVRSSDGRQLRVLFDAVGAGAGQKGRIYAYDEAARTIYGIQTQDGAAGRLGRVDQVIRTSPAS